MTTIALIACVLISREGLEARLLRADPASLPANRFLMRFATGEGEAQFQVHCAACHGRAGEGDSERGIPDLRDQDWLYGSGLVSEIERIAEYGIRSKHSKAWNLATMPAYAQAQPSMTELSLPPLAPAQIRDVIEFLLYLQRRDADASAAARGATIYADVGGCYDCHGADAKGDSAIGAPDLTDRITLYGNGDRQSLFQSIAYGRQGMCPAWINRISPAGIREIALYVFTLSRQPRSQAAAVSEVEKHAR